MHAAEKAANARLGGGKPAQAPVDWWQEPAGEKVTGTLSRVAWSLPKHLNFDQWVSCGKTQRRRVTLLSNKRGGWGGFAIHAARNYGCRVTTTTISRAQHDYALKKIAEQGLADRITVLFKDYRDLSGQFDKAVSIEMIEAVGHQFVDSYFRKCGELLKPDGIMLLQAITIADQFYESAVRNVDFIKKYIFPGSFIPSVTSLCNSITRASDMRPTISPSLRSATKTAALGYRRSALLVLPRFGDGAVGRRRP